MKAPLKTFVIVMGLFLLGAFLAELFEMIFPSLDWISVFMFWAGIVYKSIWWED